MLCTERLEGWSSENGIINNKKDQTKRVSYFPPAPVGVGLCYISKGSILLNLELFWVYWNQMGMNQETKVEKSFNKDQYK